MGWIERFAAVAFATTLTCGAAAQTKADLVVYGGNAAGVVTAVSAARDGLSVVLLEPRKHLGGLVSGGLGATDFGKKEVIGGM